MGWLCGLNLLLGAVIFGSQWLALPLILPLSLQWPMRDVVRAYSREANDLGRFLVLSVVWVPQRLAPALTYLRMPWLSAIHRGCGITSGKSAPSSVLRLGHYLF